MSERPYDVILWGATGFTGRQAAQTFAHEVGTDLRWAIAGRDDDKLGRLRGALGLRQLPILVADAADPASIDAMVSKGRVILATAGPFARYSDGVVAACVRHGTDYCDITGETPWVRSLIDRFHDEAAAKGVKIVPFCGYDSVPSDLGAWMVVEHLRSMGREPAAVRGYHVGKGGFNGGTLASMMALFEDPAAAGVMMDPVGLNPKEARTSALRAANPDVSAAAFDAALGVWTAPFFMAPVNTRVVRRSAALSAAFGEPYGAAFQYSEVMETGKSRLAAAALASAMRAMPKVASTPWGRGLIQRFGPAPGDGPSDEVMNSGFFRCRLVGSATDGTVVRGQISDKGDPGNRATVKMLCQAARALAEDRDRLPGGPGRGGVLTPATAFGAVLADRLRAAGMTVKIEE